VARALVLHSPLVGPSSVRRLAAALERRGWAITVPDLRGHLGSPQAFLAAAAASTPTTEVVVGHSGAGAFLPVVAARTSAAVTVFVDAVLPDDAPVFVPSRRFEELIDTIPTDGGLMAPWHTWWPAGALAGLVPDDALRAELVAETPRVPRSFYAEPVPLPPRWWTHPAASLQLSDAYDEERRRAEAWGWPTRPGRGGHLDLLTHPDAIADVVIALAGAAGQAVARQRDGSGSSTSP
jgi:hypothetical protein